MGAEKSFKGSSLRFLIARSRPSNALECISYDNQKLSPLLWSELIKGLHDLRVDRLELCLRQQDDERSVVRDIPVPQKLPIGGNKQPLFLLRQLPQ